MKTIDLNSVRGLTKTIATLMRHSSSGWVSWRRVAREHEGSEIFADSLRAIAELPEWSHYFVLAKNVVKLSEEGLRFACKTPEEPLTPTQQVAQAVKRYASSLEPLRIQIESISTVARAGTRFVQSVFLEKLLEDTIASETPVELRPTNGHTFTRGRVVGQEPDGYVLYIAFDNEVLAEDMPAYLTVDRGFLLHQLATRIGQLAEFPFLSLPIFEGTRTNGSVIAKHDSSAVADELAARHSPWTHFLWGPPGAGKTFGLARLITHLLRENAQARILLVAPSNRAVDVAVEQLAQQLETSPLRFLLESRKILRFGYPRKREVIERRELLGPQILDLLTENVRQLSQQIARAEQAQVSEKDLSVLRAELLAAQEQIKLVVQEHVQQSSVVATTTALAYLEHSPIWRLDWDTVIVDEVTMVPPATCLFLGALAKKRFLLAGDPRQLGPVYEDNGRPGEESLAWMGRDVFEVSQLSVGIGETRTIAERDPRLVRITAQRRCANDIWSVVKPLYTGVANAVDQQKVAEFATVPPESGCAVVLVDTKSSEKTAKCEYAHGSWQNVTTAELALEMAATIIAKRKGVVSVAVIAPYRAQVRLLRKYIREKRKLSSEWNQTEAGTVHQFQGSEADVVIFDLVDGEGRPNLGALLRGDTGIRLVNVAITRARGKLIVLADRHWCQRAFERPVNPVLWDLVLGRQAHRGDDATMRLQEKARKVLSGAAILTPMERSAIRQRLGPESLRWSDKQLVRSVLDVQ